MAGFIVAQAAGHPEQFADPALLAWAGALPALAAGYATNISLVTAAMSLDFGVSPMAVVERLRVGGLGEFVGTYLGLGLLGAWLVLFYLRVGAWSIAIVLIPVLFAR